MTLRGVINSIHHHHRALLQPRITIILLEYSYEYSTVRTLAVRILAVRYTVPAL